jgi:hypothetical protein
MESDRWKANHESAYGPIRSIAGLRAKHAIAFTQNFLQTPLETNVFSRQMTQCLN